MYSRKLKKRKRSEDSDSSAAPSIPSATMPPSPHIKQRSPESGAGGPGYAHPNAPFSPSSDVRITGRTFAHPAFADIGMRLKACNDTLGTFQQLGIHHIATLPELVLVGDQSSGKSSLMSGLARLNLPRSSGICTRCPFHIRMSSSNKDNWSCTVSLQQDYDFDPPARQIRQADVTEKNPFPPWVERPRESKVFKVIDERNATEIEDVLRWAQIATLNPDQGHEQFVPGEGAYAKKTSLEDARERTRASFSPNIVALEMKGPGLPDLSFYDLPGIIATAEKEEDDYLVKVVQNLTKHYIGREQAIIMLALPMDHDTELSNTLSIIRAAKATSRTIGVITKADRFNRGSSEDVNRWLGVLQGKKQTVGHGFYLTSLPAGKSLDGLIDWEKSFFSDASWSAVFNGYSEQCGVEHLRNHITKQLGEAFAKTLPSIKEKVHARFVEINRDLASLPELPNNVEFEVRSSLREFCRCVKESVTDSEFESLWKTLNEQFHRCINEMKPKCIFSPNSAPKPVAPPEVIDIEDSDAETPVPPKRSISRASSTRQTPVSKQKRFKPPSTPAKREVRPSPITPTPVKHETGLGLQAETDGVTNPFEDHPKNPIKLLMKDIQKCINAKTRLGFSDIVPIEVYESLSLQAVRKWQGPLHTYVEKSMEILRNAINHALMQSLGRLQRRLIFRVSQQQLRSFLDEHMVLQSSRLFEIFDNETYKVVTLNKELLDTSKEKELETLRRYRSITFLREQGVLDRNYILKNIDRMTPEEKAEEAETLAQQSGILAKDIYKKELDVAAYVRAYYRTAASRFVDSIMLDVNARLLRPFREGALDDYLDRQLGLADANPKTFDRLMEEDEQVAHKRESLKKELRKLQKAMNSIADVQNSTEEGLGIGIGGNAAFDDDDLVMEV